MRTRLRGVRLRRLQGYLLRHGASATRDVELLANRRVQGQAQRFGGRLGPQGAAAGVELPRRPCGKLRQRDRNAKPQRRGDLPVRHRSQRGFKLG